MNVASLELCKELYELSGWRDTRYFYKAISGMDYMVVAQPDNGKHRERQPTTYKWDECPAYDLGYLMRKLPAYGGKFIRQDRDGTSWVAGSDGYMEVGFRPEDAACRLCIELLKRGVLKRETSV